LIAVLLVSIIGIALGLRLPESTQPTTTSQTGTPGLIRTTSTRSTSIESFNTNTTSARGLQLVLSIEPSDVVMGGNVTVQVSVLNLLSTPQNFSMSSTDRLAYVDLYEGHITDSNITLTQNILTTDNPANPCACPVPYQTYILLGPHQASNQTFDWGGTWTRSGDQYVFNPFQKGVYTIEAFVPWVSLYVLGYFVVADPPST